jgi:hypothetical protein
MELSFCCMPQHELLDPGDQLLDAGKSSRANRSLGDNPELAMYLIRPPADFVYSHEV